MLGRPVVAGAGNAGRAVPGATREHSMPQPERVVAEQIKPLYTFQGIDNFRDFGDVATVAGVRLQPHRLLRSAHHARATPGDLEHLKALKLEVVVDLRRPTEREREASRRIDQLALLIESDLGDQTEAPHIAYLRKSGDDSIEGVSAFFTDYYRRAPFEARHLDLFRRTFAALPELHGSALIHCTAGKDRTGILAALVLAALGVHRDDRMKDYLRTNAALQTPERIAAAAPVIQSVTGRPASPATVRALLGVEAAYLEMAFKAMDDQCGSTEGYLEHLGVDGRRRERLLARFAQ